MNALEKEEIKKDIPYKKITLARLEDLVKKQIHSPYLKERIEMVKQLKEKIKSMEASINE
jgi:hypothetical protein